MQLSKETYTGDIHKKIIVSEERGRKHTAYNKNGENEVRHYRLDDGLVKNATCCDYLLLNDSKNNAYYIELKGCDIRHATEQLIAGEHLCKPYVKGYTAYYRIVTSKTRTQELKSSEYRHFQRRVGIDKIICKTNAIEENL